MIRLKMSELNKLKLYPEKLLNALEDKSFWNQLGNEMAQVIYNRTKSGYGANGDIKIKLAPLSESYKQVRKGAIRFFTKDGIVRPWLPKKGKFPSPVTGEFGTATKSNLTLTGQLLDSIKLITYKLGFKLYIPASNRDGGGTNKQVAEYVSEKRPFMSLHIGEQKIMTQKIRDRIRELTRSIIGGS